MKQLLLSSTFLFMLFCGYTQCNITVDLGNDTTVCPGIPLQFNPGSYEVYLWDDGSTGSTRTISTAGTYHVTVGVLEANLISNGDFEMGNTGFTTQYIVGMGGPFGQLSDPGTYAVTTSPNLVHTNFNSCQDRTAAAGVNQFVANGASTANTEVWCQDVIVQAGTLYQFGTWVTSVENTTNVAELQFRINGTQIGNIFSPSTLGCDWSQFTTTWSSGIVTGTIPICVINQNTSGGGNDFALDDITFNPVCIARDTIIVSNFAQPVVSISPNDLICAGETGTLTASSTTPNLTYTWMPGPVSGSQLNDDPIVTTSYTVVGVSANGCPSAPVSGSIVVNPTPIATYFINGNDTICPGQTILIDALSSVPGATFLWQPTGNTTAQQSFTGTTTTTFTLTASTAACSDDTTFTVLVLPPMDVTINGSGTICNSGSAVLTATSNTPGANFVWMPGAINNDTLTVSSPGTYYLTGSYFFCPTDTDTINVTLAPNPTLTGPPNTDACPGEVLALNATADPASSVITWSPIGLTGSSVSFVVGESMDVTITANNNGCISDPYTFHITLSAACFMEVPNVFTPDKDGTNDYFQLISYQGIKELNCLIVNRWGSTIRTFDSPDFKWDGTDESGNEVSEGVYFYLIKAKTSAEEELEQSGSVQKVR